jgi:hypothetical protein
MDKLEASKAIATSPFIGNINNFNNYNINQIFLNGQKQSPAKMIP